MPGDGDESTAGGPRLNTTDASLTTTLDALKRPSMLSSKALAHLPLSSFASTSARTLPLLLTRQDPPPFFHQHGRPGAGAADAHWSRSEELEDGCEDGLGRGLSRGRTRGVDNGKGKQPVRDGSEEEVDDREWEMRVGSGILHLRTMLPNILNPPKGSSLFPSSIFSSQVKLALPPPLPLNISSLALYSLTFSLARHGMHALYSDLDIEMNRFMVSQPPSTATPLALARRRSQISTDRRRQVRVLLTVYGSPRLPPHQPTQWQTSSLFTFSPISGLIAEHKVETIRPLPGEGAAEWLKNRLWGWRGQGQQELLGLPAHAHVGSARNGMTKEAALLNAKKPDA